MRNEIHFALEEAKPVLAIYVEETDLPLVLRLRIGDIQAIDLVEKCRLDFEVSGERSDVKVRDERPQQRSDVI